MTIDGQVTPTHNRFGVSGIIFWTSSDRRMSRNHGVWYMVYGVWPASVTIFPEADRLRPAPTDGGFALRRRARSPRREGYSPKTIYPRKKKLHPGPFQLGKKLDRVARRRSKPYKPHRHRPLPKHGAARPNGSLGDTEHTEYGVLRKSRSGTHVPE